MKSFTDLLTACIIGWIFYCGISCATLHAQKIMQLSASGLQDRKIACPDTEITFTCVTRGSAAIAWQGAFYVGDQIGFLNGQKVGQQAHSSSNPNTVATLTNNYMDNGVPVLESTLRIVASLNAPNPNSIRCIHADTGRMDSFSFHVLTDPGVPQRMISNQTVDEMGRCMLHLAWSSPSNIAIGHIMTYMIKIDGQNSVNKTNSDNSTLNLFAYSVCTCGSHTVSISAVNICHRVGPSTPNVTLQPNLLSSSTCPVIDVNTANATTADTTKPSTPTGYDENPKETPADLTVVTVILAVCVVILLPTAMVFGILWCTGTPPPKRSKTQANIVNVSDVNQETEDESKVKKDKETAITTKV